MSDNLLITMSGGTTTVINATLVGVLKAARRSGRIGRVLAGAPGVLGVLGGQVADLTDLPDDELARLRRTPGSSVTGTTRVAKLSPAELDALGAAFEARGVGYFVNIGGNGTIKQTRSVAAHLGGRLKVAAAPKTVDNDLGDADMRDVHFTPGFPSCVNYWAKRLPLLELENLGAYSHDRVLIAQTFGRETGFLAGCARVADPDRKLPLLLLLPEDQRPLTEVLGAVEDRLTRHGRCIIIMSEGYEVGELGVRRDATGQVMYGSSSAVAAQLLVSACMEAGMQARSIIPTVDQRIAIDDTLEFDLAISERLGEAAVERLLAGDSEFLISVADDPSDPIRPIPFSSFDNYSRVMPERFVERGAFDVSQAYVDYMNGLFRFSGHEQAYETREGAFAASFVAGQPWRR